MWRVWRDVCVCVCVCRPFVEPIIYKSLLQLVISNHLSNRRCRLVDGQTGFTNAEFDIMFINLQKRWEHLYLETPGSGMLHHCKYGMGLYSEVSSPSDRTKRFTLCPLADLFIPTPTRLPWETFKYGNQVETLTKPFRPPKT